MLTGFQQRPCGGSTVSSTCWCVRCRLSIPVFSAQQLHHRFEPNQPFLVAIIEPGRSLGKRQ
jgi:hypothetical protein